jgi:carbamoyl-phosphate synthase small subunit
MDSLLLLADGRLFRGRGFGARPQPPTPDSPPDTSTGAPASGFAVGEVVFNTSMTGYQEILTDPSYHGQIVVMTQPLIGNYGVNREDEESRWGRVWPVGLVVREAAAHHSNHRAKSGLDEYLAAHGVVGLDEVDTRALTRHLRDRGAMPGILAPAAAEGSAPDAYLERLAAELTAWGTMDGRRLIEEVAPDGPYTVSAEGEERFRVAAYDFGAKQSIFRLMAQLGVTVKAYPPSARPEELLADDPDGIFLSNGPGDPAACTEAVDNVRALLGKKPMFGICLGHQLMGLAVGAETYKLPFGHHGGNHPVQEVGSDQVEITAQNHGFAVERKSLEAAGGVVTHVNLNDGSIEGFELPARRAFAVQHHPEAAPGPHDGRHHFGRLLDLMET